MKKRIPGLFPPLLAFLLMFFLGASPVFAEDVPLWEVGIGVAAWHLPDYRGSDESRFYALPFPYPIYRGKIFRAQGTTLSGLLLESDRLKTDNYFSAGVTLTWFFARSKTLVPRPSHEVTQEPVLQPERSD